MSEHSDRRTPYLQGQPLVGCGLFCAGDRRLDDLFEIQAIQRDLDRAHLQCCPGEQALHQGMGLARCLHHTLCTSRDGSIILRFNCSVQRCRQSQADVAVQSVLSCSCMT